MPQFECIGETRASDRNRGKGFILLKRDPRGEHGDVGALRVWEHQNWALSAVERIEASLGRETPSFVLLSLGVV